MSSHRARAFRHPSPAVKATGRLAQTFAAALAAHQRGDLEQARAGYTNILERQADHFDALHLLGVVAVQIGQPDVAETLLGLALQQRPRSHEALGNLGLALKALGRTEEAEAALRAALSLAPNFVDALRNLASLLQARGDVSEVIDLLERAVRIAPQIAPVRANLGALLLGRGDAEAAWPHLRRAIELAPNDPGCWGNLGRAALELDRIEEGVAACERALRLAPGHVPALVSLSALERIRGRLDAAEQSARRALAHAPNERGARLNLATALADMARHEDAVAEFDRLLATDPMDVEAHTSRAAVALAQGRPEAAWQHHAWRWRLPSSRAPNPPALPEWDGSAVAEGGTLYVWPEQGIGDEIVFASAIPDLLSRARQLVVACDPRLVGLFSRSFHAARVVDSGSLHEHVEGKHPADRQCSYMDVAAFLRPTLASFPEAHGYLLPDPLRAAQWRTWLGALGYGVKVGFSWRSQNLRGERRLACTELSQWGAIFAVPGIHFVCLQYDECEAELQAAEAAFGVTIHRPPALDQRNDLDGVVALMAGLDLVLTAPTSVSTFAGAVGAPTWQLTRGVDWQGMGCERTPWQPSVRQIYQPWTVPWDIVLSQVATELAALASRHR